MAKRADGGVRFRPVGSRQQVRVTEYGPTGTGCPTIEQAVDGLYHAQNEEGFWTLMGALNYALELETRVLVPVRTDMAIHNTPAPWTEHPVPEQRAGGLPLWTLRNDKGRTWLPVFTSSAAASADRSTASRPMMEKSLQEAMELALGTKGIDGIVIDPWSHSATLDGALLNGLLHAAHGPEDPGDEEVDVGREAARAGQWEQAVDCYRRAMELGNPVGLSLMGQCLYTGRGVRQNRTEARRMWKAAAEDGNEVLAMLALGDDCAQKKDGTAKALLYYRRAQQASRKMPDIEYTPQICLRMAQTETRYVSPKRALAMAAEAAQGFAIKVREHEPDAEIWLREAQQLMQELTEQPARRTAYNIESLQMD